MATRPQSLAIDDQHSRPLSAFPQPGSGRRPAVLWIATKWPLPADDGARVATVDLIRSAARAYDVHLLALPARDEPCDPSEARALLGVREAAIVRRPDTTDEVRSWVRFARAALTSPLMPLAMGNHAHPSVRAGVTRFLERRRPFDVTVFDGLHGASTLSRAGSFVPSPRLGAIVYRAHNVESDLWAQSRKLQRNALRKSIIALQWQRTRSFERSVVQRAGRVLTVSLDDARRFAELHEEVSSARYQCIPIGMDFTAVDAPPPPREGLRLLFIGRLDWPPNRDGLAWFLREVWPSASHARPDIELEIAGSGLCDWLDPILSALPNRKRITMRGRVPSVDDLYQRASVALVPVQYGSGTRVKVLEAARFRRATLGTSLGVQGFDLVDGQTWLRAETAGQFIQAIRDLTPERCANVGEAAFAHVRSRCDSALIAERLIASLGALAR